MDPTTPEKTVQLDPIALLMHASRPVKVTVAILVVMSLMVWLIGVLKILQIGRLRSVQRDFEDKAIRAAHADELFDLAATIRHAAGSRVIARLTLPAANGSAERLRAIADRAILTERQRAASLMSPLASIASSSPFI